MLNTVTLILDKNIGMSYIAMGSTVKIVNHSSEFIAKNYLTVLLSAIESIEKGSVLSIGNNMIYNGLTIWMNKWERENYSTITSIEAKRLWKRIHSLVILKDVAITKLRGEESNVVARLKMICNKGVFISQEFEDMKSLDNWLGIEYTSNRERKRSTRNIRSTAAVCKVQARGIRQANDKDIRDSCGEQPERKRVQDRPEGKGYNEVRTRKIGDLYLHIVAGNYIRYRLSRYEECPYEEVGTRGRKIPNKNFNKMFFKAMNDKLLLEHEYKESYIYD